KRRAEEAMTNAKSDIDMARAQAELAPAAALVQFLQKIQKGVH
ncbi:ATP synthase delta/epsilon chain alpha-helix domain-containing protein, partial [Acinetobacter baumannii]